MTCSCVAGVHKVTYALTLGKNDSVRVKKGGGLRSGLLRSGDTDAIARRLSLTAEPGVHSTPRVLLTTARQTGLLAGRRVVRLHGHLPPRGSSDLHKSWSVFRQWQKLQRFVPHRSVRVLWMLGIMGSMLEL